MILMGLGISRRCSGAGLGGSRIACFTKPSISGPSASASLPGRAPFSISAEHSLDRQPLPPFWQPSHGSVFAYRCGVSRHHLVEFALSWDASRFLAAPALFVAVCSDRDRAELCPNGGAANRGGVQPVPVTVRQLGGSEARDTEPIAFADSCDNVVSDFR